LWLLYYYAPPRDAHLPTLLPSLAVGALLTAGGIAAALDDAIVGYLSDRTRSRFGRRIPYIVLGAPLWSIFFVLLFTPPPEAGDAATAAYFLIVFGAVSLFGSVVVGPYEALLPEMAPTSGERVALEEIKVYLGIGGTVIGLLVSTALVHTVARWRYRSRRSGSFRSTSRSQASGTEPGGRACPPGSGSRPP
jgi:GPH family glycoside/pentoside/hexuronide:cation symporter